MSDWRSWEQFPRASPREAKGGIRAQSKAGAFGKSWWAQRWIAVLERFQLRSRLQRGRTYARKGQVLDISIGAGVVTAGVQGSRAMPYAVKIGVKPLSEAEWTKVADVVASQAIFAAKLLAGEMPQDIEEAFAAAGVSLLPALPRDLTTECSCPDWSNPCKHVAAVYYLLGEEFDRDPFLIFQLRGMGRDEFLGRLGEMEPAREAAEEVEPLPVDAALFWNGRALPDDLLGDVSAKSAGAALPRRLGKFPFWRGEDDFLETLDRIYVESAKAARKAIGEDLE